jgi:uncharacterized protein (TIGR03435 family)
LGGHDSIDDEQRSHVIGGHMSRSLAMIVLIVLSTMGLRQADGGVSAVFEVASVKQNLTGASDSATMTSPGGLFRATNWPVRTLIMNAFSIPPFRMIGGPGWIDSERYDVTGRPPDGALPEQLPMMLQSLLRDRFALKARRHLMEQPAFGLFAASGELGPGLKPSTIDCNETTRSSEARGGTASPECGGRLGIGDRGGIIVIRGRPIAAILNPLSMVVSRAVVDRTDLQGNFDLELRWSSEPTAAAGASDTPSIYTALVEQLGLRLRPETAEVEVLVIDSIERPGPD